MPRSTTSTGVDPHRILARRVHMDFYVSTLLQLADTEEAASLLGGVDGMDVLQAAFDLSAVAVSTVDHVAVRSGRIIPASADVLDGELSIRAPGGGPAWEGSARFLRYEPPPGFDAELALTVTAGVRTADTTVTAVRTESLADILTLDAVDTWIEAEDGSLPGDPEALERRRREALVALLLDAFEEPDDWDTDAFLAQQGDRTVAEILADLDAPTHPLRVALDLEIVPDETPRTLDFRLDLYVAIHESPLDDLKTVLHKLRTARSHAVRSASPPRPPAGVPVRTPVPILVLCSEDTFDDTDLPVPEGEDIGNAAARSAARLRELNRRFRTAGIVFATA